MYWIWEVKPERDHCCEASGGLCVNPRDIPKVGPHLLSEKPLEVPFPGFELKKLDDQYYKGPPRPPGDYLLTGAEHIVSAHLQTFLENQEVQAEYYSVEIKAKVFEADQAYYYLRLMPRNACMDREKSEYEVRKYESGYESIRNVSKLVIDEAVIPEDLWMLRMQELPIILVHDQLKRAIEESDITCVNFISPEDYPRKHEIYGDLVRETTKKR